MRSSSPLILDGAMGTELERRGFDARLPLWSAWALVEAPDLVRRIHADYLRAGAQVLTAATFRTTRYMLAKENLASWAGELTTLAIRLAREAVKVVRPETEVIVAGSLAPLEDCFHPELAPPDDVLNKEHVHTAKLLAEAGADLILVETQNSAREAIIAARAALATGVPVWVSFIPRAADELLNGDSLTSAAQAVEDAGVDAVLVNCCSPDIAVAAFKTLRRALPAARLGVYPNAIAQDFPPAAFAAWASALSGEADIVGGCCGTTPDHTAALVHALQKT